ncbi:hypothetical protein GCM10023085_51340 [Actinomadura viridis]
MDGTDRPYGGAIPAVFLGARWPVRPDGTGVGATIERVMRESDARCPRVALSVAGGPRADMA